MAALAAGMVMMMTSCASAPTGDALYREGERHYVAYSTAMHGVLMAIADEDWAVDSWGAIPIPCEADSGTPGFTFSWSRDLILEDLDTDAVIAAATSAFEDAGMEASTATYGKGERQEINVIGTGGDVGRGVVTMRPGRDNAVRVTATTECFPGDAEDLSDMIFDGMIYEGAAARFPAFEGPGWEPRFYFPEEGSPVYTDEDGEPVEPQPVATDLPQAPYGG